MFVPKLKAWQAAVRPVGVPNLKALARPSAAQKKGVAVDPLLMRRSPRASPKHGPKCPPTSSRRRAAGTACLRYPQTGSERLPGSTHTVQWTHITSQVRMFQVRRRVSRGSQSTGLQTTERAPAATKQPVHNESAASSNRNAVRVCGRFFQMRLLVDCLPLRLT